VYEAFLLAALLVPITGVHGVALCLAGGRGRKKRLQKANAFVIYMLGEFVEACEAKQVRLK
jgi:hypothetical protein